MRLGFHISIAGGLDNLIRNALRRRCSTLQMFTAAPVQWARTAIREREGRRFAEELEQWDIAPHFVHAKYLLNLASPDRRLWRRGVMDLARELQAASRLGAAGVVVHLGSVGAHGAVADGVARVAEATSIALNRVPHGPPLILENAAGQGNVVGARFEQIAAIIAASDCSQRLRVCLDTAHAFAAGYQLHTARGLTRTLQEFDATVGLDRLVLVHVNDSLLPCGSGRDRHWHIGRGQIGREGMRRLVNHPLLVSLPYIMETPGTEADDIANMRRIRRLLQPHHRPPLPPSDSGHREHNRNRSETAPRPPGRG